MQIFVLDYDPCAAAKMLCDTHLRKMCLENAQILSGIMHYLDLPLAVGMPKCFNYHHKVIRALNNQQIINWVVIYNYALHREFFYRFRKKHAYNHLVGVYKKLLYQPGLTIELKNLTFDRNFKDIEPESSDILRAYREYYRYKKTVLHKFCYTKRKEPRWLTVDDKT